MPVDLARRNGIELVKTGRWAAMSGSWEPTPEDLASAVDAQACPAIAKPIIKLGHVDSRFDGEPAFGWFENLRVADGGHTLLGDQVTLPWLDSVQAAAYPSRSVEGNYRHTCSEGHTHRFVLTAVALLGVTPPAVKTIRNLNDLPAMLGVAAGAPEVPEGAQHVQVTIMAGRHAFDEHKIHRDGDGKFAHTSSGNAPDLPAAKGGPLKDALKLDGRITLGRGETLTGTGSVRSAGIAVAAINGQAGPSVRLGVNIAPDDISSWRASNKGSTAVLDSDGVAALRAALPDMLDWGDQGKAHLKSLEKRDKELSARERDLVNRQYPNLTKADAKELERIDRALPEVDRKLTSVDANQQRRIGDLPDLADRQRMTDIDSQIAAKRATGDTAAVAALQLEQRAIMWGHTPAEVQELSDLRSRGFNLSATQVARKRELSTPGNGLDSIWPMLFEQDQGRADGLLAERAALVAQRAQLTAVSKPLTASDAAELAAVNADRARLSDEQAAFVDDAHLTDGIIPGTAWGDVAYEAVMTESGPRYYMAVRPKNAGREWSIADAAEEPLESGDLRKLAALLGRAVQPAEVAAAAADEPQRTSIVVTLVPTAADADRLAVDGGEPADELHCTLAYLGDAETLGAAGQQDVIDAVSAAVNGMPVVDADIFSVSVFNPPSDNTPPDARDRSTCLVWGLSGDLISAVHDMVAAAVAGVGSGEQHQPWHAHITAMFSDDLSLLPKLADRVGPVEFDRIRISIAGQHIDIPLIDVADNEVPDYPDAELVAAAAGDDELKRYWLGDGLHRWADKPHPWRTLYKLILGKVKNVEKAKRIASRWYIDHFGHTPNQHVTASTGVTDAPALPVHTDPPAPPTTPPAPPAQVGQPAQAGLPATPQTAAPQLPAAEPEPVNQPEEDPVSLSEDMRSRLGLADDADETAALAAIDALKAKADTPTPTPEMVAASAATEAEKDELRKEVTVLASQVQTMSTQLAAAEAEKAATVKASVLDEAMRLGKFSPAEREQWESDYDEAPRAITRVLASIAVGAKVPVMASGHTGPAEPGAGSDTDWDELTAILDGPNAKAV